MVQLTRIYTRGGDSGETSLGSGKRVPKYDTRVSAYGTVDEANSVIGIVRLNIEPESDIDKMLARLQNDLFDLGADLCTPEKKSLSSKDNNEALRIVDVQVARLEKEIDELNENLSPLKSFILPGGKAASAYLHLARTIARRAEREMVELATRELVNPIALKYINRLSDHLFVLARHLNDKGTTDVLWIPGDNR
ncbi:MAG: ATP:cob(I)alamin adenosyltransferase [Rhodospirillales bacterium]|nr:ATP:cob(I)alamin adenosyltransferase [Rhodospirillales bacterium]